MQFRLHINNTSDGSRISAALRELANRVDGSEITLGQRFDFTAVPGYAIFDDIKRGSVDRVKLMEAMLGKLNAATRERILSDLPVDFVDHRTDAELREQVVQLIVKLEGNDV